MHCSTLWKIWRNWVCIGQGRKWAAEGNRADIIKEGVDRIAAANDWGVASVRTVAAATKLSVYRILKKISKLQMAHFGTPADDYGRRLEFAQWFLNNKLDNLDSAYCGLTRLIFTLMELSTPDMYLSQPRQILIISSKKRLTHLSYTCGSVFPAKLSCHHFP